MGGKEHSRLAGLSSSQGQANSEGLQLDSARVAKEEQFPVSLVDRSVNGHNQLKAGAPCGS